MPLTETENELQELNNELETEIKSVFESHGQEGIYLTDLQSELEAKGLLNDSEMYRMNQLLSRADLDSNRRITYEEFARMMKEDLRQQENRPFRRILKATIADIVPKRMREDFLANYNCCPPPLFIPIISIAEIVVFIVYKFDQESKGIHTTATEGVPRGSPLVYSPSRRYEVWRFLTYMFIHNGYMHIISNIVIQLLCGLSLEVVHKWWRVGLVYFTGVIAGGLAHSICDRDLFLVGASGGVYAMFGAHLAAVVINWNEMNYKCMDLGEMKKNVCCCFCRVLLSAPVRLAIVLIFVIPDTGLAIYNRVTFPVSQKVGVAAHMAGFLTGIMLGIVILRNIKRHIWETTLGSISLAIYLSFVGFCVLFNAFYDGYPQTDWSGY